MAAIPQCREVTRIVVTKKKVEAPIVKTHQHQNNYSSIVNTNSRHSISHYKFLQLLSHQLKRTLNYGITSLDITSARGVLFKVTLLAYSYTFTSKGTVQTFIPDLEHKAHLQAAQGRPRRPRTRLPRRHRLAVAKQNILLQLPHQHRTSMLYVLG